MLGGEIFATIFIPILLAFASVGGIGGGAVMVPLGIAFFHFASKESIAVSAVIVLESAVIRYVFFSHWKEHPEIKSRSEIDFNTVRMVYPLFLLGSYFGVICYIIFSELLIAIAMITIMGGLSIQMIRSSISKYRAETIAMQAAAEKLLNKTEPTPDSGDPAGSNEQSEPNEALEAILKREESCANQWKI